MRESELAMELSGLFVKLDNFRISSTFEEKGEYNNELIDDAVNANDAMGERMFASALQAYAKKRHDRSKTTLLEAIGRVAIPPDTDTTNNKDEVKSTTIHSDNQFTYTFRRNKCSPTLDPKKLLIELRKAGVDSETLTNAVVEATSTKAGASFHDISLTD